MTAKQFGTIRTGAGSRRWTTFPGISGKGSATSSSSSRTTGSWSRRRRVSEGWEDRGAALWAMEVAPERYRSAGR